MLRSKKATIVLSFLIAIVIWAYVIAIENPSTTRTIYRVPVQLLSVELLAQNDLAILEGTEATVDVVVSGKRADVVRLTGDDLSASANVFGLTRIGQHLVPVTVAVPPAVNLEQIRSSSILIVIDQLVSQHRRVNLSFVGEFEPGMEAGRIAIQPEQIEVKGAKTLVESVAYVNVDVPVADLLPLGSTLSLEAVPLDERGLPIGNVTLSSDVVEVSAAMLHTKTVPLDVDIVGEIDDQYEIASIDLPREVTVRGSSGDLAAIDSLAAHPVSINGIAATTSIPIEVILPGGVEVANQSASRMYVSIEIKGMATVAFEYDSAEIFLENLAEGFSAYINTPSVVLQAVGREAVLSETTQEDFTLSADLTDLDVGIFTVPVSVVYDRILSSVEVVPEEVHITIQFGQNLAPEPEPEEGRSVTPER